MLQEYFYFDGASVLGPHTGAELSSLVRDGVINDTTLIHVNGGKDWQAATTLPIWKLVVEQASFAREVVHEQPQPEDAGDPPTLIETAVETEVEVVDEQESAERKVSKYQLLRSVRKDLDTLWETQREAILSAIKNEPLPRDFELTRRQSKEFYQRIEGFVIEYWKRSSVLEEWIADITWKSKSGQTGNYIRKLRGSTEAEKYADVQRWLFENKISDLGGCYCFRQGKKYIYIGKASVLADRLKQHEKKFFWTYADSMRIVVPRIKSQITKLERLLILRYDPSENEKSGDSCNNRADECLEYIRGEIKELVTDF